VRRGLDGAKFSRGASKERERNEWQNGDCLSGWPVKRAELSPAEEALHIKRRKEVWELVQEENGDGESGNTIPTLAKSKTGRGNTQFASEIAKVTGVTKRDVNKKIARADTLGADLHKIAGTKGVKPPYPPHRALRIPP
jgi:hypothetical protein